LENAPKIKKLMRVISVIEVKMKMSGNYATTIIRYYDFHLYRIILAIPDNLKEDNAVFHYQSWDKCKKGV